MKKIKRIVALCCVIYIALCIGMYAGQRSLLYVPTHHGETPEMRGLNGVEEVEIDTKDGERLNAWVSRTANEHRPLVVFFHGNGGELQHRTRLFEEFKVQGFDFLAIDYRGFGKSSGSPSETGLFLDAKAAMDYATQTLGVPENRIIVYGESLGTGVAAYTATQYPHIKALVLQSPYTSIRRIAQLNYPWLPVTLLLKDPYDSLSRMGTITAPILIMHGAKDTLIPLNEAKTLYEATKAPKQLVVFGQAGHNDMDITAMVEAVQTFIRTTAQGSK